MNEQKYKYKAQANYVIEYLDRPKNTLKDKYKIGTIDNLSKGYSRGNKISKQTISKIKKSVNWLSMNAAQKSKITKTTQKKYIIKFHSSHLH